MEKVMGSPRILAWPLTSYVPLGWKASLSLGFFTSHGHSPIHSQVVSFKLDVKHSGVPSTQLAHTGKQSLAAKSGDSTQPPLPGCWLCCVTFRVLLDLSKLLEQGQTHYTLKY